MGELVDDLGVPSNDVLEQAHQLANRQFVGQDSCLHKLAYVKWFARLAGLPIRLAACAVEPPSCSAYGFRGQRGRPPNVAALRRP